MNIAPSFSINDRQNPAVAHTNVTINNTDVLVRIPAAPGAGSLTRTTINGNRPSQLDRQTPVNFFSALSNASKNALKALNILPEPVAVTVPGATFAADFSSLSSTDTKDAIARESIATGEKISMSVKVSPQVAATHVAVGYLKSGTSTEWVYLGDRKSTRLNPVT